MKNPLSFPMQRQPDDVTCGPTCLHGIYRSLGDDIPLDQVIAETPQLVTGGTLAAHLASHALRRGYSATIYNNNLQLFDPTWFADPSVDFSKKLTEQIAWKSNHPMLIEASRAYIEFFRLGGKLVYEDLSGDLIRSYLSRGIPVLTGLSSTNLYRSKREYGPFSKEDDIRGTPAGHFVVIVAVDPKTAEFVIADPYEDNPLGDEKTYRVSEARLIASILLGMATYDANILIVRPDSTERNVTR